MKILWVLASALLLSASASAYQGSGSGSACNDQARKLAAGPRNEYESEACNTDSLALSVPGIAKGNPMPKMCNKSWLFRDKPLFVCQIESPNSHCRVRGEKSHREHWGFNPPTQTYPDITPDLMRSVKDLIRNGEIEALTKLVACKPLKKLSEGNDWSAFQSECARISPDESHSQDQQSYLPPPGTVGYVPDPLGSNEFFYYAGDPYDLSSRGVLPVFDDGTPPISPNDLPDKLRDAYLEHLPIPAVLVRGSYRYEEYSGEQPYTRALDFVAKVSADGKFHTVATTTVFTEGEYLPMTKEIYFDGANLFFYIHGNEFTDLWLEGHDQRFVPLATVARYALNVWQWVRDPFDIHFLPGWDYGVVTGDDGAVAISVSHPDLLSAGFGPYDYHWESETAQHPSSVQYFTTSGSLQRRIDFGSYVEVDQGNFRPFSVVDTVFEPTSGAVLERTTIEIRQALRLADDALDTIQPPTGGRQLWRVWL